MQIRHAAFAGTVHPLKGSVIEADQLKAGAQQALAVVFHTATDGHCKTMPMIIQRLTAVRQRRLVQQGLQQLADHAALHLLIALGADVGQPGTSTLRFICRCRSGVTLQR